MGDVVNLQERRFKKGLSGGRVPLEDTHLDEDLAARIVRIKAGLEKIDAIMKADKEGNLYEPEK